MGETCSAYKELSPDSCYIEAIPKLCNGGWITPTLSGVCTPKPNPSIDGGVIYSGNAVYNIARVKSVLPGYNPSNTGLLEYEFEPVDVLRTWIPAVYKVTGDTVELIASGGIIERSDDGSGTTSTSTISGMCESTYNPRDSKYWLISWHEPASAAGAGLVGNFLQ